MPRSTVATSSPQSTPRTPPLPEFVEPVNDGAPPIEPPKKTETKGDKS